MTIRRIGYFRIAGDGGRNGWGSNVQYIAEEWSGLRNDKHIRTFSS
jgi:hypothetical protein